MSNRLQKERSPYLLQHAENPVDWRPWSPHVFEEAARRDLPVFLSIGYSTCHWCHVMARESFSDQAVARVINASFLPVKVDREERPDVDGVYMAACIAMNGSGGWPLTLLLTPDQKPFWAGTYLPKDQLIRLLQRADQLWREDRQALLSAGETLTAHLRQSREAPGEPPTRALLQGAEELLEQAFDSQWGGFGSPPKFPSPHTLLFLLRYGHLAHRPQAGEMALRTLDAMYRGGLFDHVGGGFSRYSTDRRWLIPHFEKMLYDNALLALAYTEGYQHTGRPLYAEVARRTLDYVLEELADPQGGFYCGQDADSQGREGGYYLFTPQELAQTLGQAGNRHFCRWYGITQAGNFEGQSLPNLLGQTEFDREPPEIAALRQQVSAYRRSRVPLHRDDKVLTAWNGLMLASLARAGMVLGEPRYTAAARRAAGFLHRYLTTGGGRLLARWREGDAAYPGTLEDHAFCAWGLLELYSATLDPAYLARAIALAELLLEFFFDPDQGGFYPYASDAEQLLTRTKDAYDGAMPSGNSAAALVLCRLSRLTGEERWRKAAQLQLSWLAGAVRQYPAGHCFGLLAFLEELWPSAQLVAAGQALPEDLFSLLGRSPRIGLTLLGKTPETAPILDTLIPFAKEYPIPGRGTCYYLCRNNTCSPPVKTVEELALLLDRDPS